MPIIEMGTHQVNAADLESLNNLANVELDTNTEGSPTIKDFNMAIKAGTNVIGMPGEETSEEVSNSGPGGVPASGDDITV